MSDPILKPYFRLPGKALIYNGDCREVIANMPPKIDSVITDPPYGLSFMGQGWDHGVPGLKFWERIMEPLRPGGHLVAFGGTRTYHRLVCAIEDAGFEIRDCLMWLYGSGFPKSMNVGKAIDKRRDDTDDLQTEVANQWEGWGTALKPAWEPIVLARKPFKGTVAKNVVAHGTGALNIDACRIGNQTRTNSSAPGKARSTMVKGMVGGTETVVHDHGRWPANLILDPEAGALLDAQTGVLGTADKRGASRFFYCAKTSKKERGEGNDHPTVKPRALMRWLCRLVTPLGGVVLDPFMGSGSTLLAANAEGFKTIGIDTEERYCEIAASRLRGNAPGGGS